MALELAVISVLAGVVLGLRFRVLILVPAVMFAMIFAVLVGVARADSVWSIVLMMVALVVAVQIGYLAGIALRAGLESICALFIGGRNPELSSLGPVWSHTWQLNSWAGPGAMTRLRQPQPPQA